MFWNAWKNHFLLSNPSFKFWNLCNLSLIVTEKPEHFEFFVYNLSSHSSSITWQPAPASVQRRKPSPPTADPPDGSCFHFAPGGLWLLRPDDTEYEHRRGTSTVAAPAVAAPSFLPGCPSSHLSLQSESQILSRHRLASFTNKKGNRSSAWSGSTFQLSCSDRPSCHM